MSMTGNYTDLEKAIIENPRTNGEANVSKRIKSAGNDYNDLVQLRSRLKALKRNLGASEGVDGDESGISRDIDDIEVQNRRSYDSSILRKKPFTFLQQFFSYKSIMSAFKYKYGNRGKVSGGLWNLLVHGSMLSPSKHTYNFAQQIISWQNELRAPFQKLYNAGWLTKPGADMLTPVEFNLIGEMQRLVSENSIFNFVINHKRPAVAIKKTNRFFGLYFSVTRDSETRLQLINAIKKSMTRNVYTEINQKKKGEQLLKTVNFLLSDEVENDFIIPLFECYYTTPLSIDEIKQYVMIDEVSGTEYNAQSSLHALMTKKKRMYNQRLLSEANRIEEEILLVSDIRGCIKKDSTGQCGVSGDYLDSLMANKFYSDAEPESNKGNIALVISDMCNFFSYYYAPVLLLEINIEMGKALKKIKIFEDSIFENEDHCIKIESRNLNNYVKNFFRNDVLQKNVENLSHKEKMFIDILNNINDAFFNIGGKLYEILKGHEKNLVSGNIRTSPIGEKDLGSTVIPYFEGNIIKTQTSEFDKLAIADKKVLPVLNEIKVFCFCFAHKFEFESRNFHETVRKESMADKINKLSKLHEKIERIESGESIGEDTIF